MSTPQPLTVAAPTLDFQAVNVTFAPLEGAVKVSVAPVLFPDGSAMLLEDFVAAQVLLSRTRAFGGVPELWDASTSTWRAVGSVNVMSLRGVPLLPPQSAGGVWRGIFSGAGQFDAAGVPLLEEAKGTLPQYRLRGLFRAKRRGIEALGLGPESPPLAFASMIPRRLGLEQTATGLRIFLRSGALQQPIGLLTMDESAGGALVRLLNLDAAGSELAAITLQPNGSIHLTPATGEKLIVPADVEVGHIRYLPDKSSTPTDLK